MSKPQKITPFFWFDHNAEEAVAFYTSLFDDSRVIHVSHWPEGGPMPAGSVLAITFELAGQRFMALNGGPEYKFSPATSMFVDCADQAETDRLWDAFLANGGKPTACGWLDDRFGVTWQIIPKALMDLMSDPDPIKAARVSAAMMKMVKIDVATLERAHRGES